MSVLVIGLTGAAIAPTALAAPPTVGPVAQTGTEIRLDAATCAAINQMIKANPQGVPAYLRGAIADLKDTDCRMVLMVTSTMSPDRLVSPSTTMCGTFYRTLPIYSGPIEVWTVHDQSSDCYDTVHAWQHDYHYCFVSAAPGFFGTANSCVVINNNSAQITLHVDFGISSYVTPWYTRYGWFENYLTKDGVWTWNSYLG